MSRRGRNLFIKSYTFRSVLSDYTQGRRIKSPQSYEEHANKPRVTRVSTLGQLQIRGSAAPMRRKRYFDSLADWFMDGNMQHVDYFF